MQHLEGCNTVVQNTRNYHVIIILEPYSTRRRAMDRYGPDKSRQLGCCDSALRTIHVCMGPAGLVCGLHRNLSRVEYMVEYIYSYVYRITHYGTVQVWNLAKLGTKEPGRRAHAWSTWLGGSADLSINIYTADQCCGPAAGRRRGDRTCSGHADRLTTVSKRPRAPPGVSQVASVAGGDGWRMGDG